MKSGIQMATNTMAKQSPSNHMEKVNYAATKAGTTMAPSPKVRDMAQESKLKTMAPGTMVSGSLATKRAKAVRTTQTSPSTVDTSKLMSAMERVS